LTKKYKHEKFYVWQTHATEQKKNIYLREVIVVSNLWIEKIFEFSLFFTRGCWNHLERITRFILTENLFGCVGWKIYGGSRSVSLVLSPHVNQILST
jgi:hypothetical protein